MSWHVLPINVAALIMMEIAVNLLQVYWPLLTTSFSFSSVNSWHSRKTHNPYMIAVSFIRVRRPLNCITFVDNTTHQLTWSCKREQSIHENVLNIFLLHIPVAMKTNNCRYFCNRGITQHSSHFIVQITSTNEARNNNSFSIPQRIIQKTVNDLWSLSNILDVLQRLQRVLC